MKMISYFKNCFEHFRLKCGKSYQPAFTPKSQQNKKILVLDLDETLVHCEFKENECFKYETLLYVIHKGQKYQVYVRTRPFLQQFLVEASKDYEIIIFTAGYEAYCEKLLEYIDINHVISDYYARSSCQFIDGVCFKDLQLLERNIDDILFIDNNPNAFDKCLDNGLLIPTFLDSDDDECLLRLIPFLKYLATKNCVKPIQQVIQEYESQTKQTLFSEECSRLTLQIQEDENQEDNETLSEGHVIKKDNQEITDLEIKHKKTSTEYEFVKSIKKKFRSATLYHG